jgi:hypothetical protein
MVGPEAVGVNLDSWTHLASMVTKAMARVIGYSRDVVSADG